MNTLHPHRRSRPPRLRRRRPRAGVRGRGTAPRWSSRSAPTASGATSRATTPTARRDAPALSRAADTDRGAAQQALRQQGRGRDPPAPDLRRLVLDHADRAPRLPAHRVRSRSAPSSWLLAAIAGHRTRSSSSSASSLAALCGWYLPSMILNRKTRGAPPPDRPRAARADRPARRHGRGGDRLQRLAAARGRGARRARSPRSCG